MSKLFSSLCALTCALAATHLVADVGDVIDFSSSEPFFIDPAPQFSSAPSFLEATPAIEQPKIQKPAKKQYET